MKLRALSFALVLLGGSVFAGSAQAAGAVLWQNNSYIKSDLPDLSRISAAVGEEKSDEKKIQQVKEFTAAFANDSLAIVRNNDSSIKEKEEALGKIFRISADYRKLAGFCLGRYINLPTKEEKEEYIPLFLKFVQVVYVKRLMPFSNAVFRVNKVVKKGPGEYIVYSAAHTKSNSDQAQSTTIPLVWWIFEDAQGKLLIFDIQVAGVWIAQEERANFTQIIARNGKFSSLLRSLRQKSGE